MSDHDPYCPVVTYQDETCVCIRLESARADERERIRLRVTELYENADLSSRAYEYIINIIEGK